MRRKCIVFYLRPRKVIVTSCRFESRVSISSYRNTRKCFGGHFTWNSGGTIFHVAEKRLLGAEMPSILRSMCSFC
jgi:hypothetical protein